MPDPGEMIHRQAGCVSYLNEKDAVTGNVEHGLQIRITREYMEGIQCKPDMQMFSAAHNLPESR